MNDTELLERYVRDRSEAAFAELVERNIGLVHATALATVGGDAHLARDVAQAVFTDLARKARSLMGRPSLGGWLYVAAHHAAAALVRGEKRRKIREAQAVILQSQLEASAAEPDWNRLRAMLDAAVLTLRDADRDVVALRFFEKRSFAEIGSALRISEEAARKRLDRALKKLRSRLGRRGLTSTAAGLACALGETGAGAAPVGLAAGIAGQALAQGAAVGVAAGVAAWFGTSTGVATVALAVGAFGVGYQHRFNARLAATVRERPELESAVLRLRGENERLAHAVAARSEQPSGPAGVAVRSDEPSVAADAPAPVPPVRSRGSVTVTAHGTLLWDRQPVTLEQFLQHLRDLDATAGAGTAVHIRNLSAFPQLSYVIDEARKAKVEHVAVESVPIPAAATNPSWF